MAKLAVIGAGSYGTCLAMMCSHAGHAVTLWCRNEPLARSMTETRENAVYLPGHALPDAVRITTDLADAVAGAHIVLGVTPSHAIREVLGRAARYLDSRAIVVNTSKGLEEGTLDRIDQIYAEIFPAQVAARAAYLSGPTFAKEVAAGLPSAIVVAGTDPDTCAEVQRELSNERFRVYTSDDVVGVLIGGALKNVVAIAAGTSDGLGLGLNTRAALITRGLAEIARMGVALGADPATFYGLSGLGDLVLTCSGDLSRNRRVGLALGQGKSLDRIIAEMNTVAEGIKTTRVASQLAHKVGVSAPITEAMYRIMYESLPVEQAITQLMTRTLKHERD